MRGSALDEARLEVQEGLVDFEREGGDRAVLADCYGLEVPFPVLLRAEHHAAASRRVGDSERPVQYALGLVEASLAWLGHAVHHRPAATVANIALASASGISRM